MKYFAFSLICVIPLIMLIIHMLFSSISHKRYYDKEINFSKISASFVPVIFRARALIDSDEVCLLKNVRWYIGQAGTIFDCGVLSIGRVKLIPVNKVDKDIFDLHEFINEVSNASDEVKSVVFDIASTIDSIFKNEHPIKFRLVEMKKMILIRVISFLMNVDHKYKNGKIKKRR